MLDCLQEKRLCWTVCKEKAEAVLECLQANFREDHITNLCFLQIKRLVYKTVTELFGIKLLDYIQNFDLCHPVGYEVFSVGGVGIPVDALKWKPPAKCFIMYYKQVFDTVPEFTQRI